jgi:hypothetical protein
VCRGFASVMAIIQIFVWTEKVLWAPLWVSSTDTTLDARPAQVVAKVQCGIWFRKLESEEF